MVSGGDVSRDDFGRDIACAVFGAKSKILLSVVLPLLTPSPLYAMRWTHRVVIRTGLVSVS